MGQCCGASKHPKQEMENNEADLSESGSYSDEYQIIQENHAKIPGVNLEALNRSDSTNSKKTKGFDKNQSEMPKVQIKSSVDAEGAIKINAKASHDSAKQPKDSSDSEKQHKNSMEQSDPKPEQPKPILNQPIEFSEPDKKKKVHFNKSKSSSSSSSSIPINISGNVGIQFLPQYPEKSLDSHSPIIISNNHINLNEHFPHHAANPHEQIVHPYTIVNEPIMHKAPTLEVNEALSVSIYSESNNPHIVSYDPPAISDN